jgi:autotransporter-associated beta strand protein
VIVTNELTVSNTSSTFINNGSIISTVNDGLRISGITSATNNGVIRGAFAGIQGQGAANTFINNGTLSGGPYGYYNNMGVITSFTNTSQITGTSNSIANTGTISVLNNSGTLTGSISNSGTIGVFTNSGSMVGDLYNNSTLNTLTNTGTLVGQVRLSGMMSTPVLGTLNNSGSIAPASGAAIAVSFMFSGTAITEINNTGSLTGGISVTNMYGGTGIATLNNSQGASTVALGYSGMLPTYYNIIISTSSNYGKLLGSTITGTTTFGISNLSVGSSIVSGTSYASVLSGITKLQLVGGSSGVISSISNGYTYVLSETASGSGIWNLLISACSACISGGSGSTPDSSGSSSSSSSTIVAGGTFAVGSVGFTVSPVFDGGTLLLSRGDRAAQPFIVSASGGTIASPSSGAAALTGVFSGVGGLTFSGSGTTIFTGANTYSGGTTVSGGTLQGNTTSLQGAITNNSQVVFDQTNQGSYASVMSGTGGLTKQNAGTLILTGANSYSGGTTVSGGTLQGNTTSLQGTIVNNSQVVFDQTNQGSYADVMSGTGGLTKQNAGTLILTGANTYSGGTTVSGGTLSLAGGSPTGTGDVFVASAGTLMGTGTIAGNSIVSGVLKPGNSPGYLSFTQNLTLNSASTYQQDIAGNVQASSATPVGASGYYSFVNVSSQLVINSGATLTPRLSNLFSASESGYGSAIYVPALGDRFRMVTATGGISGRFDTLTQPAELTSGTQFIAFYNVNGSNSLDLAVTPTSYSTTLSSSTTNAREVANVLDQILGVNKTGTATAAQDSLLYAVAGQTAANLPSFAQSLSGEVHAASAATLPQATQRVQQAVLARLGDFPMPPTQLNGAGSNPLASGAITGNNPSGLPTANVSSNPAVNPNAANITSAAITDGRAWGEIAYQRGVRSGNSGGNGYNNNLYQAVFGVDAYTNAALGLKLGGGLALSNTTVNATGGNSTIQQGALFLYGKMPVAQDYVLDGMVSLGLSSSKLSRSDVTGISNGFSNNSVMGNDVLVSAGLSRSFETSDVRITPYVRLTYQYVGRAAYDEGASAAALSVGRMSANGVRAAIGVGAGSLNKDPLKAGYTYRANVAVGAESQGLLNPTLNTTLGGYSSSVATPTAGAGFVQAGLYGTVKVADSAYAYAGVSAEARTGQTLYGGSVGLRVAF